MFFGKFWVFSEQPLLQTFVTGCFCNDIQDPKNILLSQWLSCVYFSGNVVQMRIQNPVKHLIWSFL